MCGWGGVGGRRLRLGRGEGAPEVPGPRGRSGRSPSDAAAPAREAHPVGRAEPGLAPGGRGALPGRRPRSPGIVDPSAPWPPPPPSGWRCPGLHPQGSRWGGGRPTFDPPATLIPGEGWGQPAGASRGNTGRRAGSLPDGGSFCIRHKTPAGTSLRAGRCLRTLPGITDLWGGSGLAALGVHPPLKSHSPGLGGAGTSWPRTWPPAAPGSAPRGAAASGGRLSCRQERGPDGWPCRGQK